MIPAQAIEEQFFAMQRGQVCLQRTSLHYLCSSFDVQAPARIKARGNLDIQMQDVLPKWFNLEKGAFVVDVGGYIGDTAFALTEAGCSVLSFEPFLDNYLSMLWNLRGRDVRVVFAALGNGEKVTLNHDYQDSDCGMRYMVESESGVPTMRLDDFMPWPRLDFIKLDCEGREIRVLEGAEKTIAAMRPPMLVESYPDGLARQGFTIGQLHDKIKGLGYRIYNGTTEYTDAEVNYVQNRDLICRPLQRTYEH